MTPYLKNKKMYAFIMLGLIVSYPLEGGDQTSNWGNGYQATQKGPPESSLGLSSHRKPLPKNSDQQQFQAGDRKSFLSSHRSSLTLHPQTQQEEENQNPNDNTEQNIVNSFEKSKKKGALSSLKNRLKRSPAATGISDLQHDVKDIKKRILGQLESLAYLVNLKRTTLIKGAHINDLDYLCSKEYPQKNKRACAELIGRAKGNQNAKALTQAGIACKSYGSKDLDSCFKNIFGNLHSSFRLAKRTWPIVCNNATIDDEIKIQTGEQSTPFEEKLQRLYNVEKCSKALKTASSFKK